jgi:hypothetical protein
MGNADGRSSPLICVRVYSTIGEARKGLTIWFHRYDKWRRHDGTNVLTIGLDKVYRSTLPNTRNAASTGAPHHLDLAPLYPDWDSWIAVLRHMEVLRGT